MNKEITPLSEKIDVSCPMCPNENIKVEDVKLAVQQLKEEIEDYQEDYANLEWIDKDHAIEVIDKIFGELAK